MKNVVLLCECNFTRAGLETLLKPDTQVFSTADIEQCQRHLSRSLDAKVDLVVISTDNYRVDSLIRLATLIGYAHPSCQVLINPGSTSLPLLRLYLNGLNNYVGLIDFTQPVLTLQRVIGQVMQGKTMLSARECFCGELLSGREHTVLQKLIKELKIHEIAKSLSLNVKTVSHYKRAGLRKLGARHIQELLMPAIRHSPCAGDGVKEGDVYVNKENTCSIYREYGAANLMGRATCCYQKMPEKTLSAAMP
jgi:DNA-binding NarL/FixJ family response regulator